METEYRYYLGQEPFFIKDDGRSKLLTSSMEKDEEGHYTYRHKLRPHIIEWLNDRNIQHKLYIELFKIGSVEFSAPAYVEFDNEDSLLLFKLTFT